MTVSIDQITAANWSPRLDAPGDIVADRDDIDQCIGIIITTRKGSDPHRPLFGCDAWQYLDQPISIAIPNIIREVVDALEAWEPRVVVVSVKASFTVAGQATVTIDWRPRDAATIMTREVQLGNAN